MTVSRLIYHSACRLDSAPDTNIRQLNDILATANRVNRSNGVTGALIFDGHCFVQALEGDRQAVGSIFKKIEVDPRHSDIALIEWVDDVDRHFANWWMGCAERNGLNAPLFEPYVREGRFRPAVLSAPQALSLLIDLEDGGLSRELAA